MDWSGLAGSAVQGHGKAAVAHSTRTKLLRSHCDRAEVVIALDRKTGKERWRAEWKGAMTIPFFAASNGSWIRSTPAHDGERLCVAGMCDVLACLDAKTGKEVWRVDFAKELKTPLPDFGFTCSPLLDGNAV